MTAFPNAVRQFSLAAHERRAEAPRPPATPGRQPHRRAHRVVARLWIPATPIFWLLAPFALLAAPLAWLAPPVYRPANPFAAALAVGRLLTALSGTIVDVETPDALVRLRIL